MNITEEKLSKLMNEKSKGGNKFRVMNLVERYHKYSTDPEFELKSLTDPKMYGDVYQFYQELTEL